MDTTKIVRGDDLMLFDSNKKSLAFATSHTLTLTADVVEISCKDSGKWKDASVNKLGWEITSENLFCDTEYKKLYDIWKTGQPIYVYFGAKVSNGGGGSVTQTWAKVMTKAGDLFCNQISGATVSFGYDKLLSTDNGYVPYLNDLDGPVNNKTLNLTTALSAGQNYVSAAAVGNEPVMMGYMTDGSWSNDAITVGNAILSTWTTSTSGGSSDGIDSPTDAWSANTANLMGGKALITNISVNAASGDNATISITLQGVGDYTTV